MTLFRQAKADAEEVANWNLDARRGFAIPVNPQDMVLQMIRFVAGDVIAEIGDAPRPFHVGVLEDARDARGAERFEKLLPLRRIGGATGHGHLLPQVHQFGIRRP